MHFLLCYFFYRIFFVLFVFYYFVYLLFGCLFHRCCLVLWWIKDYHYKKTNLLSGLEPPMHRSGYSTQNIYNQIGRHLGEWRLKNLFTTHNRERPCLVEHDLQWDWRIALGWSTWNKSRERAGTREKKIYFTDNGRRVPAQDRFTAGQRRIASSAPVCHGRFVLSASDNTAAEVMNKTHCWSCHCRLHSHVSRNIPIWD